MAKGIVGKCTRSNNAKSFSHCVLQGVHILKGRSRRTGHARNILPHSVYTIHRKKTVVPHVLHLYYIAVYLRSQHLWNEARKAAAQVNKIPCVRVSSDWRPSNQLILVPNQILDFALQCITNSRSIPIRPKQSIVASYGVDVRIRQLDARKTCIAPTVRVRCDIRIGVKSIDVEIYWTVYSWIAFGPPQVCEMFPGHVITH